MRKGKRRPAWPASLLGPLIDSLALHRHLTGTPATRAVRDEVIAYLAVASAKGEQVQAPEAKEP